MLEFIEIYGLNNGSWLSKYPYIYDSEGLPYLIQSKTMEWIVNDVIHGTTPKKGTYVWVDNVFYLMYEEPCFYV